MSRSFLAAVARRSADTNVAPAQMEAGESMPSAELVQLAEIVPAACVLYATTTRTQGTPELQWQLASYADVELLMGEAPTLIGCVHEDP